MAKGVKAWEAEYDDEKGFGDEGEIVPEDEKESGPNEYCYESKVLMGDRDDLRLTILARMIIEGIYKEDEDKKKKKDDGMMSMGDELEPSPQKRQRVLFGFGFPRASSKGPSPTDAHSFREIVATSRDLFRLLCN